MRPLHEILTVNGAFEAYLNTVFKGVPIGEVQKLELKKAFYGAVHWLLEVQKEYVSLIESEDEAVAFLERILAETVQFGKGLPDNGPGGMTEEPLIVVPPHIKRH